MGYIHSREYYTFEQTEQNHFLPLIYVVTYPIQSSKINITD